MDTPWSETSGGSVNPHFISTFRWWNGHTMVIQWTFDNDSTSTGTLIIGALANPSFLNSNNESIAVEPFTVVVSADTTDTSHAFMDALIASTPSYFYDITANASRQVELVTFTSDKVLTLVVTQGSLPLMNDSENETNVVVLGISFPGLQFATVAAFLKTTPCPLSLSLTDSSAPQLLTFSATLCNKGFFLNVTGSDTYSCAPCLVGSAAGFAGSVECSACQAGSFASTSGQSECTLCPVDTYAAVSAGECIPCPQGKVSPAESSSIDACVTSTPPSPPPSPTPSPSLSWILDLIWVVALLGVVFASVHVLCERTRKQ